MQQDVQLRPVEDVRVTGIFLQEDRLSFDGSESFWENSDDVPTGKYSTWRRNLSGILFHIGMYVKSQCTVHICIHMYHMIAEVERASVYTHIHCTGM